MARSGLPTGAKVTIAVAIIAAVGSVATAVATGLLMQEPDAEPETSVSVAGATLTSPALQFYSRCRTTFSLTATIDVEGGTGPIVYRWLRSDEFENPTLASDRRVTQVDGPGSVVVTDEWTPTIPKGDVSRTTTLEVLEPEAVRSNALTISGRCDASLPEGPPVPPPDVAPPGG